MLHSLVKKKKRLRLPLGHRGTHWADRALLLTFAENE